MELTICCKPLFTGEPVHLGGGSWKAALRWLTPPQAGPGLCGPSREERMLAKEFLVPAEAERYRSFYRNAERQRELLHTRLLAKRFIRGYLEENRGMSVRHDRDIALLQEERGDRRGNPYLSIAGCPDNSGLSVSLAHCSRLLGAAVGEHCQVGIDVEPIRPVGKGFPALFLIPEEQELMRSAFGPLAFEEQCLLMWCLKEAAGKALGTGWARGFSSLRFRPAGNSGRVGLKLHPELERYAPKPPAQGTLYYDVRDGICGAVCLLYPVRQGGSRESI
ncbi:4'-phosphopantetheinyl transferase family protein [Paenibacillus macerans]|uniref:4'-phosphopantetheinyl transferase family protein n=1 Tax=Paenibacillus macerans TaxID=44252 RepID=UPI003D3167B9